MRKGIILILSAFLSGPVFASSAATQTKPRAETAMRRLVPKPAFQLPSAGSRAERTLSAKSGKGFVLSLGGGPAFPSTWDTASSFTQWIFPEKAFQGGTEVNSMSLSLKSQMRVGFGVGLAYYFSPKLGLFFRIDIIARRPISDGLSVFSMTWKWWDFPSTYSLDPPPAWPVSGSLRAQPVSLGLAARFPVGSSGLQTYLQAGISYFLARFRAESRVGYARTMSEGNSQYVDYYSLPVSIDEFFNGIGFTGGAGLEWLLGPKTAVFIQADCYTGPSEEVGWSLTPGTYHGHFFSAPLTIDNNSAQALRIYIPTFSVETGLMFRLLAGLKILL